MLQRVALVALAAVCVAVLEGAALAQDGADVAISVRGQLVVLRRRDPEAEEGGPLAGQEADDPVVEQRRDLGFVQRCHGSGA